MMSNAFYQGLGTDPDPRPRKFSKPCLSSIPYTRRRGMDYVGGGRGQFLAPDIRHIEDGRFEFNIHQHDIQSNG